MPKSSENFLVCKYLQCSIALRKEWMHPQCSSGYKDWITEIARGALESIANLSEIRTQFWNTVHDWHLILDAQQQDSIQYLENNQGFAISFKQIWNPYHHNKILSLPTRASKTL